MAITPSLVAARSSGIVPLAVFFDATGTLSDQTTREFHEVLYWWDFGDSGSGNHPTITGMPTRSRNIATGPMAVHVFETAGSYTVTLYVFDGVDTAQTTVEITASAWEEGVTGTTLVVAQDNDFTGAPSHAATSTSSDWDSIINTNVGTHKRILFKNGDGGTRGTYTCGSTVTIDVDGPGIIGTWGSGTKPLVEMSGDFIAVSFSGATTPTIDDWRVMDFEIDGNSNAASVGVDHLGGIDQITLLRLDIHHTHYGIRHSASLVEFWNTNGDPGHELWDQHAFVDCTVDTTIGGSGGNGMFVYGQRFGIIGCVIDDTTAAEHVLRIPYVYKMVIANCDLKNPASTKHTIKLHSTLASTPTIVVSSSTQYVQILDGKYEGGTGCAWVLSLGPRDTNEDLSPADVIVERNWFSPQASTQRPIHGQGMQGATIRNNVFDLTGNSTHVGADVVTLDTEPDPTNNHYYNNTFYSNSTGNFFGVIFSTGTGHIAKNNLGYAPLANTTISFIDGSPTESDNTDDADVAVDPDFASATPANPADFYITAGSPYEAAGASVPNYIDFIRRSRINVTNDMGFYQLNAGDAFPAEGGSAIAEQEITAVGLWEAQTNPSIISVW